MGNLNLPGRAADTRGGWLTRRNLSSFAREWAVIHLGVTGLLSGCEVDTAHFLGNHPREVSVEGCYSMEERPEDDVDVSWATLLPRTSVGPDALHRFDFFETARGAKFTHVRVLIFPDGGLSRVRIFGTVDPDAAGPPAAEASKSGAAAASRAASKQRHPLSQSTTADFGEAGGAADPRGIVRSQTKASLRSVRSSSSNASGGGSPGSKRKRTH
ncbi:MAG: Allantoicase repeat-domain-containing protein [Olpidium bornovanus]|uniref:Allantoicase repeat-domain-containing protein n=1 Tax=Olpidium bornovanus TaxID=278681 RepID=A0A8H8DDZ4_9FUNG|nr:MAG: Allantoicase repeat-domain-containing protein [Olpidium bornovanus]